MYDTGGARKWSVDGVSGSVVNDYKSIKLSSDLTAVTVGKVITLNASVIINVTTNNALILPTAIGNGGRAYTIIAAEQCSLQAAAGETLDGLLPATPTVIQKYQVLKVISYNTQWYCLSNPRRGYEDYKTTTATTYNCTIQDSFIAYAGSGAKSVVLPTAIGNLGKIYTIRAVVDFTLSSAGGQIEQPGGGLGATLAVGLRLTVKVISDNANWELMQTVA